MSSHEDLLSYDDALANLADGILGESLGVPDVGSFKNFVEKYWSQSYERPNLFLTWHVGYLCEELEAAMAAGKHFCALVPRFHLKSTILGYAFSVWMFLKHAGSRFDSSGMYLSYSDPMSRYHIAEM